MFTTYNVDTNGELSSLFKEAFGRAAEGLGFTAIMTLGAPDMVVWEYQKEEHIISLHTYSAKKSQTHIVIESHTLDLTGLISTTLKELTAEQLVTLLEPIRPVSRSDIDGALGTLFAQLGIPEAGPDA